MSNRDLQNMNERELFMLLLEQWNVIPLIFKGRVTLEGRYGNVLGNPGATVDFEFDDDGRFTRVGVYS